MGGVLVERARADEELVELGIVVVLGVGLLDGGNKVIRSAALELTRLGGLLVVTVIAAVVATIMIVAAIIIAPIILELIMPARRAVVPWRSRKVLMVTQVGLLGVGILLGGGEHVADGGWRLPVKLPAELVVMVEALTKVVMTLDSRILGTRFLTSEKCRM